MPEETVSTFEHAGATMVYTESGRETELSFVLVHGIGMGHRVFRGVAEELDKAGRVFAVDLPGFGDSPEPAEAMSMEITGDYLAAFVRSLPVTRPVLVGHSMGTQVVCEAVVRHPQIADRIVLIAPTVTASERGVRIQAWRMLQDLAGESLKVLTLGLVQYAKTGPRWFIRKLRAMLDHRLEEVLPRVQAATLVLRGETDRVCPHDWVAGVADALPHAIMREIPGRGHEAMITRPEPVASMIVDHARGRTPRPEPA